MCAVVQAFNIVGSPRSFTVALLRLAHRGACRDESLVAQRVMTADSGQCGLDLFRQHHSTIDLVLLDLTMPELSGAEVLHDLGRIRHDVNGVVTSGFHPSNAADLHKLPNVLGFLEKPHTMANLEAIEATLLSN